jgi:hypothetical protein
MGTSYTEKINLFLARGMRKQALALSADQSNLLLGVEIYSR